MEQDESLAEIILQIEVLKARNLRLAQAPIWTDLSRLQAGGAWSEFARAVVALEMNPRYAVKVAKGDDKTYEIILIDREKAS